MHVSKSKQIELLRSVWLFNECSRRELDRLVTVAHVEEVEAKRQLIHADNVGGEFVVIIEGKAEVVRHGHVLATLGPGEFAGEMALLDRQVRVASVTTLEPSTVLRLTGANFDMVLREMPSCTRKILTVVSRRLREVETQYILGDG
jgi:CRP/FNR family cyclic AMP-dependent transcriptional regulator